MPPSNLAPSLVPWLAALAPCFTAPSFESFCHLVVGWIVCLGRHPLTRVIQAAGAVDLKHHSSFHRLFRRARWVPDQVGLCLLRLVLGFVPREAPVFLAVDDTLGRHTGKHIRGAAMHHDPLLSTRTKAVFHWGHLWVVLAVVLEVPRWDKRFAVPVLCRLYRTKATCGAEAQPFHTRTELARDLIALVAQTLPTRTLYVLGDATYTNQVTLRCLPSNVHLIGRAAMEAGLYALPEPKYQGRGRPRKKGEREPSPAARAADAKGWETLSVRVYGRQVAVEVKTFDALWYRVARGRLLRFVLVRGWPGHDKDDVLLSSDVLLSAPDIIARYCLRWSIEVTFEEVKGKLGFEDPQNRTPQAVERTAPMALWSYTLTVLWYVHRFGHRRVLPLPQTPWYRKSVPAFSDMLAALRIEIWQHRIWGGRPRGRPRPKFLATWMQEAAYAT